VRGLAGHTAGEVVRQIEEEAETVVDMVMHAPGELIDDLAEEINKDIREFTGATEYLSPRHLGVEEKKNLTRERVAQIEGENKKRACALLWPCCFPNLPLDGSEVDHGAASSRGGNRQRWMDTWRSAIAEIRQGRARRLRRAERLIIWQLSAKKELLSPPK
jgi:hypothetical protein